MPPRARVYRTRLPLKTSACLYGVDLSGRKLTNFCETDAILVPKWQVAEKIFKRAEAALGEQLRAVRSYTLQVHQFG